MHSGGISTAYCLAVPRTSVKAGLSDPDLGVEVHLGFALDTGRLGLRMVAQLQRYHLHAKLQPCSRQAVPPLQPRNPIAGALPGSSAG